MGIAGKYHNNEITHHVRNKGVRQGVGLSVAVDDTLELHFGVLRREGAPDLIAAFFSMIATLMSHSAFA